MKSRPAQPVLRPTPEFATGPFSEIEMRRINDQVFAVVQHLDAEGWGTKSAVNHALEAQLMKLRVG